MLQQDDVFHVMRVREHIYGLNSHDLVVGVHDAQVPGLSSGVATYVHNAVGSGF